MSKLTKLINEPEKFIADAFKKKKKLIATEVKLLNKAFEVLGVPTRLDVNILESQFIQFGVANIEKHNIRHHLVSLMYMQSSIRTRDPKVVVACFNARYGEQAELLHELDNYISPKVNHILGIIKAAK